MALLSKYLDVNGQLYAQLQNWEVGLEISEMNWKVKIRTLKTNEKTIKRIFTGSCLN